MHLAVVAWQNHGNVNLHPQPVRYATHVKESQHVEYCLRQSKLTSCDASTIRQTGKPYLGPISGRMLPYARVTLWKEDRTPVATYDI